MSEAHQDDSGFRDAPFTNLGDNEMLQICYGGRYPCFVIVIARRKIGNVEPARTNSPLIISDWSVGSGECVRRLPWTDGNGAYA